MNHNKVNPVASQAANSPRPSSTVANVNAIISPVASPAANASSPAANAKDISPSPSSTVANASSPSPSSTVTNVNANVNASSPIVSSPIAISPISQDASSPIAISPISQDASSPIVGGSDAISQDASSGPLPAGWIEKEFNGKTVYIHLPTEHTTYDRPTDATPTPIPEPLLPPGWKMMTDRPTIYYKNETLGLVQDDRPGIPSVASPALPSVASPSVATVGACDTTLPLDSVPAECSSNAPPPPLKAYILSILTPILEESADALFQTLRVKPYELAETAVTDAVMTQALTPEVLERMKALDDPQVQKVLAGFKANVQTAVQQTFDTLNKGVGDNVGELLGSVANKLSGAIQSLIADIPGWGIVMSGAQLADAGIAVAEQGRTIANEVAQALAPLNAVQAQVAEVRSAVDVASGQTPAVAGKAPTSEALTSAASEQAPGVLPEQAPGVVAGKAPEQVPGQAPGVLPQTEASEDAAKNKDVKPKGGSRKRHRIHKLSRRIERTLRRVQKKYGLKDKNDFLRRTLRARKMK
jgi:hypothetical protein